MSAPMKQMLKICYFTKIKHKQLLFILKRCASVNSNISFKSPSTNESEEDLSRRAQRKKRALELYLKKHNLRKSFINEKSPSETKYYIENGMRKVYPYYHTFTTYTKGRWVGRTLLDVFTAECRKDKIPHAEHIKYGNVTVNGEKVPPDFVLDNNMKIEYYIHRHEMPVLNEPIEVIEDTDDLLVINKPSSIPVHPCGRYRYNSITMLLRHELGYENLRTLYRLDRLTSGVLILPKTTTVSKRLEKQLEKKELHKEYVCRVEGEFPDGDIKCNEPLGCMSYKLSLYRVDPEGKPSSTTFTRLSYNGKTSVVKCVPHTGRTHQIRVHLQFLGFPICNDPLYNSTAFGRNKGKGGVIEKPQEELEAEIMKTSNIGRWKIGDNPKYYEKYGNKKAEGDSTSEDGEVSEPKQASSDGVSDVQLKAFDVDNKEMASCENENDAGDDSEAKLAHNLDGSVREVSCASDEKTKVCYDSLKQKQDNIAKACEIEESAQNSESLSEVSDNPCKRTKIENDPREKQNVADTFGDKRSDKEACDTQHTEEIKDKIKINKPSKGNITKHVAESKETIENLAVESNNEDMSGESVLAKTVTDLKVVENKIVVDEFCQDCKYIFEDPKPEELILYLHAVRYKGVDWEYSTALPYWAQEDFDDA